MELNIISANNVKQFVTRVKHSVIMWCRNTFTGVKCALEMTIVFPLRIEMSSVKHIVAAARSRN